MNEFTFCKGTETDYLLNTETGEMWQLIREGNTTFVLKPIEKK